MDFYEGDPDFIPEYVEAQFLKPGDIIVGRYKPDPDTWCGIDRVYEVISYKDENIKVRVHKPVKGRSDVHVGDIHYWYLSIHATFYAYYNNLKSITKFGKLINDIYVKELEKKK